MESFWSTPKIEHPFRHRFLDPVADHRAIFHYIEGFYNSRRLHSALGYRTPLDFESVSKPRLVIDLLYWRRGAAPTGRNSRSTNCPTVRVSALSFQRRR